MSQITLENYEAYLLDYAEGQLSAELSAELMLFLAQHPELAVDLEGITDVQLPPDESISPVAFSHLSKTVETLSAELDEHLFALIEGKSNAHTEAEIERIIALEPSLARHKAAFLKTKLAVDVDQILPNKLNLQKAEEFQHWWNTVLVAEVEGTLTPEERARMDALTLVWPELHRERSLMLQTRVSPEAIAFPIKSKLYKSAASRGSIIPLFARYAAAAVLILSVGFFALNQSRRENELALSVRNSVADPEPVRKAKTGANDSLDQVNPKTPKQQESQNDVPRWQPLQPSAPERLVAQVENLPNLRVEVSEPFALNTEYMTISPLERLRFEQDLIDATATASSELSRSQRSLKALRKLLKRNNIDIEEPIERIGQQGIDELSYQGLEKVSRGFIKVNRENENGSRRVTGFSIGSLSYTRPSR
jgi:hypothetical protein